MDETIIKRVMPNSLEAEQSVIGSVLTNAQSVALSAEIITPDEQYITKATEIVSDKTKEELEVANTNDELWIKFERAPKNYKFALARTKEIKNDDITS